MTRLFRCSAFTLTMILALGQLAFVPPAMAVEFTTSYQDGASWNSLYGQGFKASINSSPNPGHAATDVVHLDRFQFFKSGNADATASFRLAILNNFFVDLTTLTTSSPELEGLSTNVINGTASIPTGSPITFEFDSLELIYGDGIDSPDNNYAAVFVTEGTGGALTPLLVPVLLADYIEDPPGSGTYRPESNYGDPDINYFLTTSNCRWSGTSCADGNFFSTFNAPYADATFIAYFDLEETTPTGDFNLDGQVDAADYVMWRKNGGSTEDYNLWLEQFGTTGGSGGSAVAGVPEPASLAIVSVAAGCWLLMSASHREL
jgi:hypothetical protein